MFYVKTFLPKRVKLRPTLIGFPYSTKPTGKFQITSSYNLGINLLIPLRLQYLYCKVL